MVVLFFPMSLLLAGLGITVVLFVYGLLRNERGYSAVSGVLSGLLLLVSAAWYYWAQLDSLREAGRTFPSEDLVIVAGAAFIGGLLMMWGAFWLWVHRGSRAKSA